MDAFSIILSIVTFAVLILLGIVFLRLLVTANTARRFPAKYQVKIVRGIGRPIGGVPKFSLRDNDNITESDTRVHRYAVLMVAMYTIVIFILLVSLYHALFLIGL
jgi:hypothetical protein